jgi:alkylation response protein AidB-like acyl-CoA dehydrogenase
MEIALTSAWSAVRQAAMDLSATKADSPRQLAEVLTTKEIATTNAISVVDNAMLVLGGLSYLKRTPLERLYRDVRAGRVHPPVGYDSKEIIGKAILDIPLNIEPQWG